MSKKIKKKTDKPTKDEKFPLPVYNEEEDIYKQEKEVPLDDEDDPGLKKTGNKDKGVTPGDDLDIPGAELDDEDEAIGEEDEENNYYSLGGDDHDDLEEDRQ